MFFDFPFNFENEPKNKNQTNQQNMSDGILTSREVFSRILMKEELKNEVRRHERKRRKKNSVPNENTEFLGEPPKTVTIQDVNDFFKKPITKNPEKKENFTKEQLTKYKKDKKITKQTRKEKIKKLIQENKNYKIEQQNLIRSIVKIKTELLIESEIQQCRQEELKFLKDYYSKFQTRIKLREKAKLEKLKNLQNPNLQLEITLNENNQKEATNEKNSFFFENVPTFDSFDSLFNFNSDPNKDIFNNTKQEKDVNEKNIQTKLNSQLPQTQTKTQTQTQLSTQKPITNLIASKIPQIINQQKQTQSNKIDLITHQFGPSVSSIEASSKKQLNSQIETNNTKKNNPNKEWDYTFGDQNNHFDWNMLNNKNDQPNDKNEINFDFDLGFGANSNQKNDLWGNSERGNSKSVSNKSIKNINITSSISTSSSSSSSSSNSKSFNSKKKKKNGNKPQVKFLDNKNLFFLVSALERHKKEITNENEKD
ncbi:hypothetical protein M0813_18369 [Anaeramoeba flamelloides]|uniref:Uncharacterized protein n=1 Tax=Anaeramoeba flamelloides TaxID=1746091 RepID=A0ABQ8YT81_9EUKA|nr:hypothetical protein M0813_18369 [Anaeramoeba flamelloides]